jgi:hypothetical protein
MQHAGCAVWKDLAQQLPRNSQLIMRNRLSTIATSYDLDQLLRTWLEAAFGDMTEAEAQKCNPARRARARVQCHMSREYSEARGLEILGSRLHQHDSAVSEGMQGA